MKNLEPSAVSAHQKQPQTQMIKLSSQNLYPMCYFTKLIFIFIIQTMIKHKCVFGHGTRTIVPLCTSPNCPSPTLGPRITLLRSTAHALAATSRKLS
jgi:hypothetical protein